MEIDSSIPAICSVWLENNDTQQQGPLVWYYTGSFSKVVLGQGVVKRVFLGVFLMFSAFFHSKIWAQFHFGTFNSYK